MTIPYVLDGEAREYTPDVIVHLDDGRAFIIEAKPLVGLGDFMKPDPESHELVTGEVKAGEVAGGECSALERLVGKEQLALIATAELLDWRADIGRVRHAGGPDRDEAQQLWALIDPHRDMQLTDSPPGVRLSRDANEAWRREARDRASTGRREPWTSSACPPRTMSASY